MSNNATNPGLKPWAILYSRFAANSLALRARLPSNPFLLRRPKLRWTGRDKGRTESQFEDERENAGNRAALVASVPAYRILRTDFQGGFRCRQLGTSLRLLGEEDTRLVVA